MLKTREVITFYNANNKKNKKCLNLIYMISEFMQINPDS